MRTKTPPPPPIPLMKAAEMVGMPPTTLRQWCAVGAVPGALQLSGRWLIPADQIEAIRNREVSFGVRKNSRPNQPTQRRPARPRPGWSPGARNDAGPDPSD